jgi:ribonucleoside-triphosphate reductase (thioredoxin)
MSKTPWGPVGFLTAKRTYMRKKGNRTEEFPEAIERVVKACRTQLKVGFTDQEEEDLRNYLLELKGMVAGRFLWQLGTNTVTKLGLASLQNCAACVVDHPIRPFTWAMDMLMLGSGVGYNIQKKYVYEIREKIKRVKISRQDTKDADFIVPDSREGWVELLRRVLEAHFITGEGFTYSTICIRNEGEPIKSFGGTASGPKVLCDGMQWIHEVLLNRAGKKLRPVDALDIMNIIGYIVVAGNVRRSAQIAIGDCDDLQFLSAKRWDLGAIPNWRAMSNNSVVCNDISKLPEQFWEGYKGNGEPYGLINLNLSRKIGRIGETDYPDPDVVAYNPCAEQSLADYETCCLAEIYLPNIKSKDELLSVAKALYRINKHSLALRCHHRETQDIVHKHSRMGIGVTGYLQASLEQRGWLSDCYARLRDFDRSYSEAHGFPESIKLTTVKPSGTLSLLAGTTSGVHPGYSQYFIRRIRIASSSPLIDVCISHGYHVEPVLNFDGTPDPNTSVVEFPCSYPEGTVCAKDVTAVDQLNYVKELQTNWSDNAVSCTVYYKKEELPQIKKWLSDNYNENTKSVSFLLHSDHGFKQSPFEEITKEKYLELKNKTIQITSAEVLEEDMELNECENGACPVK